MPRFFNFFSFASTISGFSNTGVTQSDIMADKSNPTSVNLAAQVIVPKFHLFNLSKKILELIPVIEKPENVKQKEQRLKTLGSKYLVNIFSDILLLNETPVGEIKFEKKISLVDSFLSRTS